MKHCDRVRKILNLVMILFLAGASVLSTAQPARASADIQVTTIDDEAGENPAACSLREAVISANKNIAFGGCARGEDGIDVIRVPAQNKPYVLTRSGIDDEAMVGDLDIRGSVDIQGSGAKNTVIQGNGGDRVFHILTSGYVLLSNLTITQGGSVTKGAGILQEKGSLTLTRVHIVGNSVVGPSSGGGLTVLSGAVADVQFSEISNNTAQIAGGVVNEGTLTISSSLIYDNKGLDSVGGISANSQKSTEYTQIINTTIAQNRTKAGSGAGISLAGFSTLYLLNSTIINNEGVGIEVKSDGLGWIKNSIVARQRSGENIISNCIMPSSHQFVSAGYNLTTDTSCGLSATGDKTVAIGALKIGGDLTFLGGDTRTYAVSEDSPAVDAGTNSGCPSTDQRRYSRPASGTSGSPARCDIGALELNGSSFQMFFPILLR